MQDLETDGSPQRLSLDWIVFDDPLFLCPDDPKLVQRYVMAVFYYSTEGDDWRDCSAPAGYSDREISDANGMCRLRGDAWLTPVSECDWGGLECHNDAQKEGRMDVIDFRKWTGCGYRGRRVIFYLTGWLTFELKNLPEIHFSRSL